MDSFSNLVECIKTHTPRKYEKTYYSHNEVFWGERGALLAGPKWLERERKDLLEVFIMNREGD